MSRVGKVAPVIYKSLFILKYRAWTILNCDWNKTKTNTKTKTRKTDRKESNSSLWSSASLLLLGTENPSLLLLGMHTENDVQILCNTFVKALSSKAECGCWNRTPGTCLSHCKLKNLSNEPLKSALPSCSSTEERADDPSASPAVMWHLCLTAHPVLSTSSERLATASVPVQPSARWQWKPLSSGLATGSLQSLFMVLYLKNKLEMWELVKNTWRITGHGLTVRNKQNREQTWWLLLYMGVHSNHCSQHLHYTSGHCESASRHPQSSRQMPYWWVKKTVRNRLA